MTNRDWMNISTNSWLASHKCTQYAINQDPTCPILLKHLVVQAFVSMDVCKEKGLVQERSEAAAKCVNDILAYERFLTKNSANKVVRLAFRDGRWMKELNEKYVCESKGYDEHERAFQGDGEVNDDIPTGLIELEATTAGGIETADALHARNVYVIKELLQLGLYKMKESDAQSLLKEKRLKDNINAACQP